MSEEVEELKCFFSVGSYGPFPIIFFRQNGEYFYIPLEEDERGPFSSLEDAIGDAELDFGATDGGFHESLEDAESHAEWMRQQGYQVE